MQNKLVIAAIQMVSSADVEHNLATAERLIQQAVNKGANFVVLPEFFAYFSKKSLVESGIGEEFGVGKLQVWQRKIAQQHKIWFAAGSIPLLTDDPNKVSNSLLFYSPDGECLSRYDKINMFRISSEKIKIDESINMQAGNNIVFADTKFGRIGMSLCYDARFPSLYEAMGDLNIILVPAAFTYATGKDHWEIVLRARALDNQCFVIGSAQGGQHEPGLATWGHSMIINPWGKILTSMEDGEGFVISEIDLDLIAKSREMLPVVRDRKALVPLLR